MCPSLSIRLPEKLKTGMDRLRDRVKWNEEIRDFIRERIEEERKRDLLEDLEAGITKLPKAPRGTAARLVREDRDRH